MARLVERLRAGVAWHNGYMTRCQKCSRDLPDDAFSDWGLSRGECRECTSRRNREYGQSNRQRRNERLRAWRKANPEAARQKDLRARLKRKYGLAPEHVDEMNEAQDGRCLLCDSTTRTLVVDHCHATGRVRGLLCRSCNTIVGQVEMSPLLIERLVGYLGHDVHPGLASSSNTSA